MSIIGIDFSTISNKICCFDKYGLRILANNYKNTSTPSVAYLIHKDKWIFGERAIKIGINKANKFIFDTKLMLGKKFNDKKIINNSKYWPFKIFEDKSNIKIMIEVDNETQEFHPYDITSLILKNLLQFSQLSNIKKISQIAISIPVRYDENQIDELKKAANLAGFQKCNFQIDPILASLAYLHAININITYPNNIIIYDLGSSHLDVSFIILNNQNYEIFTEKGEINGKQFDDNVYNYVVKMMYENYQQKAEFLDRPKTQSILRQKCEEAKVYLSEIEELDIILDDDDDNQLIFNLTIEKFNELNNELFDKSMDPLKKLMEEHKIEYELIDNVFLVGGLTYMKKIRELLLNTTKKVPCPKVDPREAVAIGASIAGAWHISNEMNEKNNAEKNVFDSLPASFRQIVDVLMRKTQKNGNFQLEGEISSSKNSKEEEDNKLNLSKTTFPLKNNNLNDIKDGLPKPKEVDFSENNAHKMEDNLFEEQNSPKTKEVNDSTKSNNSSQSENSPRLSENIRFSLKSNKALLGKKKSLESKEVTDSVKSNDCSSKEMKSFNKKKDNTPLVSNCESCEQLKGTFSLESKKKNENGSILKKFLDSNSSSGSGIDTASNVRKQNTNHELNHEFESNQNCQIDQSEKKIETNKSKSSDSQGKQNIRLKPGVISPKPLTSNYSSKPLKSNYSSETSTSNYSSKPLKSNYSSKTSASNYASKTSTSNYSSKTTPSHASKVPTPNYSQEKSPNYVKKIKKNTTNNSSYSKKKSYPFRSNSNSLISLKRDPNIYGQNKTTYSYLPTQRNSRVSTSIQDSKSKSPKFGNGKKKFNNK